MGLTLFAVQNAKPREKPYKLADGNGLHLLVTPNGSKLWRLRYRFGGKQKMIGLGSFPQVSIAEAREKRNDARKLVSLGIDPSGQRKAEKAAAETSAQNTFGAAAAEYLAKLEAEGKAEATRSKNKWLLEVLAARLTPRPIKEITPHEILTILKKVETEGKRETARRLRTTIGGVFRFAIANLKAEQDPTYALRGALLKPIVTHRAAITDEEKLGQLMRAVETYDGRWPVIVAAIQVLALTMARPGEVRFMRRQEIDIAKATWTIPAERMKMRREHQVPLSRQALEVLQRVWPRSEGHELVFPSMYSWAKPLSENTMNKTMAKLGYAGVMTSHGFRASASTILNERGYSPDVIEAALAHQDQNEIRRAYNRALYWPERVKLLQDWADLLDSFKEKRAAA